MIHELSQRFHFEAAHTLEREVESAPSRRIHGHTYLAELGIAGKPDPGTGMVMDLGRLREIVAHVRSRLDHHMLNDVEGLGAPTLENLCSYLWREFEREGCAPERIVVRREATGDCCTLRRESS